MNLNTTNSAPRVSIVMAVYNRASYLETAIASVLAQSYSDIELLVWDDGSTDQSLAIAQAYEQRDERVKVISGPHEGVTHALRGAIARSSGCYVGVVDSDDALAPIAVEETVRVLEEQPHVGLVYSDYWVMDERGWVQRLGQRCQIPYSKERLLVDFMTFHFRLMRRNVYERVGGVDVSFTYAHDYDLCLKISEVTEIYHLRKPLYAYRLHQSSISQQRRSEQGWFSQKAINDALQRRGMAEQWRLEVEDERRYFLRQR